MGSAHLQSSRGECLSAFREGLSGRPCTTPLAGLPPSVGPASTHQQKPPNDWPRMLQRPPEEEVCGTAARRISSASRTMLSALGAATGWPLNCKRHRQRDPAAVGI